MDGRADGQAVEGRSGEQHSGTALAYRADQVPGAGSACNGAWGRGYRAVDGRTEVWAVLKVALAVIV